MQPRIDFDSLFPDMDGTSVNQKIKPSTLVREFYREAISSSTTGYTFDIALVNNKTELSIDDKFIWLYKEAPKHIQTINKFSITNIESNWLKPDFCHFDKEIHEKIFKKLIKLIQDFDEDSEILNTECSYVASLISSILADIALLPRRIVKSMEGSILFEFKNGDDFSSIEVFNDGEIVFLQDKGGELFVNNLVVSQLEETLRTLNK